MTKFKTLRHALMMTAATLGGTIIAAAPDRPAYAQEAVRTYAIPAQSLDGALRAFAMQTGRDVLYPPAIVAGKRSPGAQGLSTEQQALAALLVGTGLRFERTASGGYAVQDAASPTRTGEAGGEMSASELEDVVVTGTNIRGSGPVGSPVLVFTREDFENAGADTPQEFMATVVQNFGGTQSADNIQPGFTGNNNTFGSGLDLRGLGPGTTLVLLNGRRLPLSGSAAYVDISMIPISAIDRIEILTDGASAIYGSDAIGGVVNIITRSNYVGADSSLSFSAPSHGGGDEYRASQSFGASWGSGSALFTLEAYKIDPINNADRNILDDPASAFQQISSGQERFSFLGSVQQSLTEGVQLVADLTYSGRDAAGVSAFPIYGYSQVWSSRNTALSDSLGVNLDLPRGWVASISATHSLAESDADVVYQEFNFSTTTQFSYEILGVDATASGSLTNLPAGPLRAAFGLGYRQETFSAEGSYPTPEDSFSEAHAFAEFNIPVLGSPVWSASPRLKLSLAARYDDYEQYGSSLDPRVGLDFLFSPGLKFRAAYSTSFRAPTIEQVKTNYNSVIVRDIIVPATEPNRALTLAGVDPDLGPETSTNWSAGLVWEPPTISGLSVSVNWYDIAYQDRIDSPPLIDFPDMLADAAYDDFILRRGEIPDSEFDALISAYLAAGPVVTFPPPFCAAPCPGPASEFGYILTTTRLTNLAATHQSGIDLRVRQTIESILGGQLELGLDTTYVFDLSRKTTEAAPSRNALNLLYEPVDLRARGSVVWRGDKWQFAVYGNYVGAHINNGITPNERIPAFTTFDATVRWDLGRGVMHSPLSGVQLLINVNNIFDDVPPPVEMSNGYHSYDYASSDPWGRVISFTITKKW